MLSGGFVGLHTALAQQGCDLVVYSFQPRLGQVHHQHHVFARALWLHPCLEKLILIYTAKCLGTAVLGDLQIPRLALLFVHAIVYTLLQMCSSGLIPGLQHGE